jgi:hypothetical protein
MQCTSLATADGGETDAMAAGISKEAGGSDQPPAEAALPEPPGTSEEPTFLENVFGDCASYPNVLWAQEVGELSGCDSARICSCMRFLR